MPGLLRRLKVLQVAMEVVRVESGQPLTVGTGVEGDDELDKVVDGSNRSCVVQVCHGGSFIGFGGQSHDVFARWIRVSSSMRLSRQTTPREVVVAEGRGHDRWALQR